MSMSIQEILAELGTFDGVYKRAAVDAAIAHEAEITPELIALLEQVAENPKPYASDENFYGHIYAVMLLAQFQAMESHEALINIFAVSPPFPEGLFGDLITEHLPILLLRTCGGSLDHIQQLAENPNADEYCRGSAAQAMAYGVVEGLTSRETLLTWFSDMLKAADPKTITDADLSLYV